MTVGGTLITSVRKAILSGEISPLHRNIWNVATSCDGLGASPLRRIPIGIIRRWIPRIVRPSAPATVRAISTVGTRFFLIAHFIHLSASYGCDMDCTYLVDSRYPKTTHSFHGAAQCDQLPSMPPSCNPHRSDLAGERWLAGSANRWSCTTFSCRRCSGYARSFWRALGSVLDKWQDADTSPIRHRDEPE